MIEVKIVKEELGIDFLLCKIYAPKRESDGVYKAFVGEIKFNDLNFQDIYELED